MIQTQVRRKSRSILTKRVTRKAMQGYATRMKNRLLWLSIFSTIKKLDQDSRCILNKPNLNRKVTTSQEKLEKLTKSYKHKLKHVRHKLRLGMKKTKSKAAA